MLPALGCAPDMPPSPDDTKSIPLMSLVPPLALSCLRQALSTVMVVPCTMPCGPMYIYDPAVICPYWLTPSAFMRSQSSGLE